MKLKTLMVALLVMLLVAAPASSTHAARSQVPQASLGAQSFSGYQIVALHSGKCLDVPGGLTDNGIGMHQWTCEGPSNPNQIWQLVWVGTGYQIISSRSGKCLDVPGGLTGDGVRIHQWTCEGPSNPNQIWQLVWVGTGYQIISSRSGKCLEVGGFSVADGGVVQQWSCGTQVGSQTWNLYYW